MAGENTVTLIGNLTRDPELRFTPSGAATCSSSIAVNRRWKNNQTNEWEEATSFFNLVMWRDLAEHFSESCTRGMRVVLTGRLEQRSWETQEGDKRSIVEIVVDEIGPSLRWATAQVSKVTRENANSGGGGQSRGGGSRQSRNAAPDDGYGYDEEPF